MPERLTEYFIGTASKILSAVETGKTERHHQHEFNGVTQLKNLLGAERKEFPAKFLYIGSDGQEMDSDSGSVTWYDSRAAHPTRSEFRLYFSTNFIPDHANPGDAMILGLRPDNTIYVIICDPDSDSYGWVLWLFGIEQCGDRFAIRNEQATSRITVTPAMQFVLMQLGIELPYAAQSNLLEVMQSRFGNNFPSTNVFSAFARETIPETISTNDPDAALVVWITHEERLFRTFEHFLVSTRLDEGFEGENRVDDFVAYSLHVHNRRKSRAGSALENHMEFLLQEKHINFERGAKTEGRSKPDFLFPGSREYHDYAFPACRLTMLGSKTTAKDRWRQILAEADRISPKHLLTLQAGISVHQLAEMQSHHVIPVIPQGIRESYSPALQSGILSVSDFITLVTDRQARS